MEEKKFEIRSLVASDMGIVCKILSAIGVKQFKECFDVAGMKNMDVQEVGMNVMLNMAGVIISNVPSAEADIHTFLSSLTGMKVSEIQKMPFADYGELIMEVIAKDDFKDFFKRVMKLFNR